MELFMLSLNMRAFKTFLSCVLLLAVFSSEVFGFDKGTQRHLIQGGILVSGTALDNKIDPGLRFMTRWYEAAAGEAPRWFDASALTNGSLYFKLLPREGSSVPDAQVFIKLRVPGETLALEQLGVQITTTVGDIVIARLPITATYAVAALENVVSMQISGRSTPHLDLSRAEVRADVVHAGGGGLAASYRGTGVVVGVLDSGIDWTHPDFSVAANNTRIQFLFDYSNGTNGREWTKAEIDAGTCTEIDGPGGGGHGTHVAGTAAGNGRRNAAYVGMAPEADIVFVKGTRDAQSGGGFDDADVVAGTQYIFAKARAMNKPAVVNLSLGGHFGPHDGTSLYEQALSSLVRPGNIIVAAAGNEGHQAIHVSYPAQGSNYDESLETLWGVEQGSPIALADMWYPASGNISVGVAVYQFGNYNQPEFVLNAVPPGQRVENQLVSIGAIPVGLVTIDATTTQDPNNGARRVAILINSDNGQYPIDQVAWSVWTIGSGTFDMWAAAGGEFPQVPNLPAWFRQGDNDKTVGMPGTARKVLCIGSYVTKTSWIDLDGTTQTQPSICGNPNPPQVAEISCFSSRGPSRDGRTKPDLTAPGEAIIAALSSSLTIGTHIPRSDVLQGGGLVKLQGTSMASPHITGIVALMLQRNRYLTYENVFNFLTSTARPVGPSPNNTFGSGKVDALNAVLAVPPAVDCQTLGKIAGIDCDGNVIGDYQLINAYPNPFNPATTIGFRVARREKVTIAVFDLLGRRVKTLINEELPAGYHQTVWDGTDENAHGVASGVYHVRLVTPSYNGSSRLVLIR